MSSPLHSSSSDSGSNSASDSDSSSVDSSMETRTVEMVNSPKSSPPPPLQQPQPKHQPQPYSAAPVETSPPLLSPGIYEAEEEKRQTRSNIKKEPASSSDSSTPRSSHSESEDSTKKKTRRKRKHIVSQSSVSADSDSADESPVRAKMLKPVTRASPRTKSRDTSDTEFNEESRSYSSTTIPNLLQMSALDDDFNRPSTSSLRSDKSAAIVDTTPDSSGNDSEGSRLPKDFNNEKQFALPLTRPPRFSNLVTRKVASSPSKLGADHQSVQGKKKNHTRRKLFFTPKRDSKVGNGRKGGKIDDDNERSCRLSDIPSSSSQSSPEWPASSK